MDQLNRHIAQLDYRATRARLASVLVTALLPVVGSTTIILGTLRINEKRLSDEWVLIVGMILVGVTSVAPSFWSSAAGCNGICCRASAAWRRC